MASETLTSLAILKVNIDRGGDYLDYLVPFVLQILADHRPDPVTSEAVCSFIRDDFGLEIPDRAVQIVLQRVARKHWIQRINHVYRIQGEIPNPGIAAERAVASRHIKAVVLGLIEFSKPSPKALNTEEEATEAICGFLSEFNIPCLRAYLRGTAIPDLAQKRSSDVVLVAQYVIDLQQHDPERFDSFLIMLQGHMLANALLCPDLDRAPKTYKGVTFFLDTPLIVRLLGVEGEQRKSAASELTRLVRHLGARVAAFSHSRDELIEVLRGAAEHVNSPAGRGPIILEARRSGISRSDLLLLAERAEEEFARLNIEIVRTPGYEEKHRKLEIGESAFERALDDEVTYNNPRARQNDIRSVRSIYILRGNSAPFSVERSRATLVTSNTGFARAAFEYGKSIEQSRDVSSVITDFSLANMAWLKAPMGAPSLPRAEVLAFSYAAFHPSRELLDKYLAEIEKLEQSGKISERDHQLLRSSVSAQEELMKITLGDDAELTESTVMQVLERVSSAIRDEERGRTEAEANAHRKTRAQLKFEIASGARLQERLYWKCNNTAKIATHTLGLIFLVLLCVGLLQGVLAGVHRHSLPSWLMAAGSAFLLVLSFFNYAKGTTIKSVLDRLHRKVLTSLVQRESEAVGRDINTREA